MKYVFKAVNSEVSEARWVFALACFLSLFAIKSVWEGLMGDNLHEVSEGFHIGFHVLSLCATLASIAYTRENKESTSKYTYGSERFEVIATFGNSIFLIFIAGFAVMEVVHESVLGEGSKSVPITNSLILKVLYEIVVLVKLFRFLDRKGQASATEDNLAVIAIHCFTLLWNDTLDLVDGFFQLSSTSGITQYFYSGGIVILAIVSIIMVKPYLELSGRILLQCAPQGRQQDLLVKAMRDVKLIEGVITVREEHFWQYTDDKLVASLVLKVHPSADHNLVVTIAQEVMRSLAFDVTVEVSSEVASS